MRSTIRFCLVGLLFWPAFAAGAAMDEWLLGALLGLAVVAAGEVLTWRLTFGHWPHMLLAPRNEVRKTHPDTYEPPARQIR